ncbi:MAG: hypothetical protein KKH28_04860 [Elusimicrobia bacterium]|nr:hypothetical protein [Elusimicrobiota bacterium]
MKLACFIYAGLVACAVVAASAGEGMQLGALYRINSETEVKIQGQVLDRLLGPGRAFVFLETRAEVKRSISEEAKGGIGETRVVSPKGPTEGGADMAKSDKVQKKVSTQEQRASQEKKSVEANDTFNFTIGSLKLRILHDASVPVGKLQAVKNALLALYPDKVKAENIVFVPAAFEPAPAK